MQLQVPGKTYLVGEYSVLLGGSALGLATQPCFDISYNVESKIAFQFHPESPAGLYLKKHGKSVSVSISDPYPGGFGRSTAEYISVVAADIIEKKQDFFEVLKEYKSLHQGSGIDLAFQYFGQVCLVDPLIQFYQTFNWHFQNLDFYILSTGLKVSTHEHLKNLDLKKLADLPALSHKITHVYAQNKEFEFLSLMKEWCALLKKHNLTHESSLEMKNTLESFAPIKLAKPCGALGADVMLVFFAKNQREDVYSYLVENKFKVQAHSSDLSSGVVQQLRGNKNVD
jgi:mevalonate kinase